MNTITLQQAALHLPKQERAHLVHLLLDSLDQPSAEDIQQQWANEAGNRANEIDQGRVQLIAAEDFEGQVKALFK